MSPAWTERCPMGHAAIDSRKDGYRCGSCETVYAGETFDAREHDFPVDEELVKERQMVEPRAVLTAMVGMINSDDKVINDVRASHLPASLGDNRQIGAALRVLHDRGFIEPVAECDTHGNRWRPTNKGFSAISEDWWTDSESGEFVEVAGVVADD